MGEEGSDSRPPTSLTVMVRRALFFVIADVPTKFHSYEPLQILHTAQLLFSFFDAVRKGRMITLPVVEDFELPITCYATFHKGEWTVLKSSYNISRS